MGYRIDYVKDSEWHANRMDRRLRLRALTAAGILCFSLAVKKSWPEGTELMQNYLLPESISKGQTSVQYLISDLRAGTDFREALTAFCLNILDNET